MRNIIILSIATFALLAASCSKEKTNSKEFIKKCDKTCDKECTKDDKSIAYYSEDYKTQGTTILDWDVANIEALWYEIYSKDAEYDSYALVAKSLDGEIRKEYGPCQIDWYNTLSFSPEDQESYTGNFTVEKEEFTVDFGGEDREELVTFIFKDC